MRKLRIATLLLNIVCLLGICQPLAVLAGSGSGGGSDPCSADPTKYALDTNDDGAVDLSDFVYGLSWLFSGGTAPLICLDTTDLEASLAQAQADLALPAPPSGFPCRTNRLEDAQSGCRLRRAYTPSDPEHSN